jgi:endonuclease IV
MLGIHVSRISKVLEKPNKDRDSMLNAIITDTSMLKINMAQIFTHGPRNYAANKMDHKGIKDYAHAHNINLVVHSTYVTQLLKVIDKDPKKAKMNIVHIEKQLKACSEIGAMGLVIHLPKHSDDVPNQITSALKVLEPYSEQYNTTILLEISAHKPSESYANPDNFNTLCETIHNKIKDHTWGICVDSAHVWASEVDISTAAQTKEWLSKLHYQHKIKLFHFNGSSSPFGVNKDVHEVAFSKEDKIWPTHTFKMEDIKKTGGYKIVKFCKKNRIPIICEINRGTENSAEKSLYAIKYILEY